MSSSETTVAAELCPSCHSSVDESWLTCAHCGCPLSAPAELPPGTMLHEDRYRVVGVLGRGGFGITYVAQDTRLHRRVAIKELFPESVVRHGVMALAAPELRNAFREAKTRFLREARVLARFSHPGIVRAYEVFEEHNTAYLVMELIEGQTLTQLLRDRNPLPEAEVLSIAGKVAAALDEVHAAGVLHRDINPSNIVVTEAGRVVLIDFGIARRFDSATTGPLTRMVTPGYAPPEQYSQERGLGPPADVYALAATVYRSLTGTIPTSALDRQQGRHLASPRAVRADVSKATSDAVLDGLELDPTHRPHDMRAFVRRLGMNDADWVQPSEQVGAPSDAVAAVTRAATDRPPPVAPPAGPAAGPTAVPPARPVFIPPPLPPVTPPPLPVASAAARPGEPAVVGPHPKGRGKVTVPLAVACASLASASVTPVMAVLVLAVAPWLATAGDLVVHQHRQRAGAASRRWHQLAPSTVAPVRAVRNIVASIVWSIPGLAVAAVTIVAGIVTKDPKLHVAHDLLVRAGGAMAAVLVAWPVARGGPSLRSGLGIDAILVRFVDGRGRLRQAGWILWIVAVAVAAFGLWLSPEVWPFR
ncbi:MAG: serine/threonine-protein kinase [Acidimicrobiales bacterium]